MISIIPEDFNEFRCKAGACRHTCCQKWEIDIDSDTAAYYRSLPGPLGERLRAAIEENEEGCCFRLNPEGYCFFLRRDGLCEIVTALGEDKLCDICTVHPRFFTYVEDYVLCGTGLCCEKTCELLASRQTPLVFTEEGTERSLDLETLLAELDLPLSTAQCHFRPCIDFSYYQALLARLAKTEPIDAAWTEEMESLPGQIPRLVQKARTYAAHCDRILFDRLYQFILYRQLDKALTWGQEAIAVYARESTDYIFLTAARTGDPLEAMRRWSEQIEYDTENVDLILEQLAAAQS